MKLEEDLIDFNLPEADNSIITVIGVGGGGNNAVNRMYQQGIRDVDFFVANTDAQTLAKSIVPVKVQLGESLTQGRGAGNRAEIGEQAAIESADKIRESIKNPARMAFIVAGMGGGTGTGATPVIARICRDKNLLTVGVVTLPFRFEGPVRMKQAIAGIETLKNEVDALLIIHNEKLREIYGNLTLSNAFANADNILMLAVKGIAEIITIHGYVNVDFADVFSVMSQGGIAFMGSASAGGSDRAKRVIEKAINSPLLNNNDIKGAGRVLLNITSGTEEITVDEIGNITDTIIEKVKGKVNTIWGTCTDETLEDEIRITLVATGFGNESIPELFTSNPPQKTVVELPDKKVDSLFEELESDKVSQDIIENEQESETIVELESDTKAFAETEDNPESNEPSNELFTSDSAKNDITKIEKDNNTDSLEKINSARLKALNYNNIYSPEDIDQIEKIPAYKRKKEPVQPEIFPKDETESRYTIGSGDAKLRANNSYLHDPVD